MARAGTVADLVGSKHVTRGTRSIWYCQSCTRSVFTIARDSGYVPYSFQCPSKCGHVIGLQVEGFTALFSLRPEFEWITPDPIEWERFRDRLPHLFRHDGSTLRWGEWINRNGLIPQPLPSQPSMRTA